MKNAVIGSCFSRTYTSSSQKDVLLKNITLVLKGSEVAELHPYFFQENGISNSAPLVYSISYQALLCKYIAGKV
jgi:hypothetical protein